MTGTLAVGQEPRPLREDLPEKAAATHSLASQSGEVSSPGTLPSRLILLEGQFSLQAFLKTPSTSFGECTRTASSTNLRQHHCYVVITSGRFGQLDQSFRLLRQDNC